MLKKMLFTSMGAIAIFGSFIFYCVKVPRIQESVEDENGHITINASLKYYRAQLDATKAPKSSMSYTQKVLKNS